MADLFASCESDGQNFEDIDIKTDNTYAKKYDDWRRKEELMKAKKKFGDDIESDSSDEEEEDEEATNWTPYHEKSFLCTLSALKGRDPKIYDKSEILFEDIPANATTKTPALREKCMTLKDYERKIISQEGGIYADEDESLPNSKLLDVTHTNELAYDQEQKDIRKSFKEAAWQDESDVEDQENVVIKKKEVRADQELEQEEYAKWLKGETKKLANKKDAKNLRSLRNFWNDVEDENVDSAEKFLRDYILNRRYITTGETKPKFEVDFSEDEKDLEEMNEFEHKYNFRFEDPDPDFIKKYPRTIDDSLRRKNTKRAERKADKKQRKDKELTQYKEEVNRLKDMKKKEILRKIEKLRHIAGSDELEFDLGDLEDDFDPQGHDKRMAQLFSTFDDEAGDEDYPKLDENEDDDLCTEDWDHYGDSDGTILTPESAQVNNNRKIRETEDLPSRSNALVQHASTNNAGNESSKAAKLTLEDILPQKKQKKRKKSTFAEIIAQKRPVFDPERDKTFETYFDDYYRLDFEDLVGGAPTRFKYRKVVPNDFGLSVGEILTAKDQELNKWCSLKKMVQYRSETEENEDLLKFSRRREKHQLKKKILSSVYMETDENSMEEMASQRPTEVTKKVRSRKNKKKGRSNRALPRTSEDTSSECGRALPSSANEVYLEQNGEKVSRRRSCMKVDANEQESEEHPSVRTEHNNVLSKNTNETTCEKLTFKQKKNRRNALLRKRKKKVIKEQHEQKKTSLKEKFRPLHDLQMSKARMIAYGLDPNRVKGDVVYGKKSRDSTR